MALLDDAITASGGMDRWSKLKRFTLHLSIDGSLLSRTGRPGHRELVAEGSTKTQSVRFTGLAGAETSATYQPDSVTIESLDGQVLRTWASPALPIPDAAATDWFADDLHLVFFCGLSIWNYVTTPFRLVHPDVETTELPLWNESGQAWRRLRATFPPDIATLSREQIFYFDDKGLQRRTDYELFGMNVAHYSWAHQAFGNIMLPTLRRSLTLQDDGTVLPKPVLIDVEIFDATFE